jgi:phenylpyruvate tautomerase PptA (4-oxalocrotonate tautomerase family)
MDENDIKEKWARAAGENKVKEPYTPKFKRRRLGEKGIGRFSLAKLGNIVKVITKPEYKKCQYVFNLDFRDFTDDRNFDDMQINYTSGQPRKNFFQGTILEIHNLHEKWRKRDVERAKNQLTHLIDPEKKDQNFNITFQSSDYPELSGLITNPLSGQKSHRLHFMIDKNGNYKIETKIGDEKKIKKERREPLICGPVEGIIRYYKEGVKSRDRKFADDDGESHMGVKVYRDGCRVRPYGEENDDWLEIKSKRERRGGKYYILSNAIAGSIYISRTTNPKLEDATNREAGMIENDSFLEFQLFVQEQIDLLNHIMEQETSSNSQKQKRQIVQKILDTVVECLNKEESDIYGEYISKIDRRLSGQYGQTTKKRESKVRDLKPMSKEEWHCKDCDEIWRVIQGNVPIKCMDIAVNRDGELRHREGCGSLNIERSKHQPQKHKSDLTAIVAGNYALISGRQLKLTVDYDMGSNDDEYTIRAREIAINGNHVTYQVAEHLDRMSGKKYEIGDDVLVPALTVHIAKCSCIAWADLHYKETKNWDEYKKRYENLQTNIYQQIKKELGFK